LKKIQNTKNRKEKKRKGTCTWWFTAIALFSGIGDIAYQGPLAEEKYKHV